MQFVRASVRLPNKEGSYHCREISDGSKYVYRFSFNHRRSYFYLRPWAFEWLDEEGGLSKVELEAIFKQINEAANKIEQFTKTP